MSKKPMLFHTLLSYTHMKLTTVHQQNQKCLSSTLSLHVIPRHSASTPGRPALYTTTHPLFPELISTSRTTTCVSGIQKKLGSSWVIYRYVVILQHKPVRPTSKQKMKQTHFWLFICFVSTVLDRRLDYYESLKRAKDKNYIWISVWWKAKN